MVKDHKGDNYRNEFEMYDAWGIDKARRKRNWSLKDALTLPAESPVISKKDMFL